MYVGPQIEELLLKGRAVFRNASIGYAGLSALQIPKGQAIIITEINLEPFLNFINTTDAFGIQNTLASSQQQPLQKLWQRIEYNLSVVNQRGRHTWTFRNDYKIDTYIDGAGVDYTLPAIELRQRKIKTFIVADDTTFFNFTYPNFLDLQISLQLNPISTVFKKVNFFPSGPSGYIPAFQTIEVVQIPVVGGFSYLPLGTENSQSTYNNLGSRITYPNISTATDEGTSIVYPTPDNALTPLDAHYLPSLPLINVSYIEINKLSVSEGILKL